MSKNESEIISEVDRIARENRRAERGEGRRRGGVPQGGGRRAREGGRPRPSVRDVGRRPGARPAAGGGGGGAAGARVRVDRDGRDHALLRRGGAREARPRVGPHATWPRASTSRRSPSPRRGRAATSGRRSARRSAHGANVRLDAQKSWVTSASHADCYVWSSKPVDGRGPEHALARPAQGHRPAGRPSPFEGLGLRGNDSSPVARRERRGRRGRAARRRRRGLRHHDGASCCRCSTCCTAACSARHHGERRGAARSSTSASTRFEHLRSTLADLPTIRAYIARMRIAHRPRPRRCSLDTIDAHREAAAPTRCSACSRARRRRARRRRSHRPGDARVRRRGVPQGGRRRARLPRRARRDGDGADDRRALRLHRQGRLRHARCSEEHDR